MIDERPHTCPLCGSQGTPDERPITEIAGLEFQSVVCGESGEVPDARGGGMPSHIFPVRWLEAEAQDSDHLQHFIKRFTYVRGPLPGGTPIAEAFGDIDPIRAWIEHAPENTEPVRVLIRL